MLLDPIKKLMGLKVPIKSPTTGEEELFCLQMLALH